MLPAVPMQQASPVAQLLLLHFFSNSSYGELQNNITVCDVEQFKLQNNIISSLEQRLQKSTVEKQELEQKLLNMAERNQELIGKLMKKNLELFKQVEKLEEEKRDYQMQTTDSRSRLNFISHQAEVMESTLEALGKQLSFVTDEVRKPSLPRPNSMIREMQDFQQKNNSKEHSALNKIRTGYVWDMVQVSAELKPLDDQGGATVQDREFTIAETITESTPLSDDASNLKKLSLPIANNKINHYETEVGFNMGAGCKIIMKAIMENGSTIQFNLLGEDDETKFELTFNLENKTVHDDFNGRSVHVWGTKVFELQREKESTITIKFKEVGLQMCIDENSNCKMFIYPYPGNFFNKIKISDVELHDIRLYVPETSKSTYIKHSLDCSRNICDLRKVPKIGTVFSFTVKMPDNDHWLGSNFRISASTIPIHMSIRRSVRTGETVFNHMEDNNWDGSTEEKEYWFPFKRGQTYTVTFHIQKHGTTISVDGVFFHYFKHRIDVEAVTEFQHDLEMINASYSTITEEILVPEMLNIINA